MSAPEWLATVLAEHWCGAAHPGLSLRRDPDHEDGRLRLGACFDCQRHASHVAAVVWAEFKARAQQARRDVARSVRDTVRVGPFGPNSQAVHLAGGSVSLTPDEARGAADAAVAALLRAIGGTP